LRNAKSIQIALDSRLSDSDRGLAVRYLLQPRTLTPNERLRALRVFDELGGSTITVDAQTQTFSAFYRAQIEAQYADAFLDQLLATAATDGS
jgi:hypothetical protein